MSGFPPRVFIIGAQKSGTTSLAALLDQHPDICLSNPKEPNYFTAHFDKGENWYKERFADLTKVLVDASTTYTMLPLSDASLVFKEGRKYLQNVAEKIYRCSPDAKLIYIIREPVSRLYSNYWHNIKYGYENNEFELAIQADPLYIEMSFYAKQLEEYEKYFSNEQILLIKFEDLIHNQRKILNICEEFIGVSLTDSDIESKKENAGGQYNFLARIIMKYNILKNLDKFMPDNMRKFIKNKMSNKLPKLTDGRRLELSKLFIEDQSILIEKYGVGYTKLAQGDIE